MILPTMLPAGVASGSSPDVDLIATNTDHMELQDSDTFSLLPKHNKPTSRCNRCFTRHWVVPVTLFTTLAVIALVGVLFMAFGVKKIIQSQVDQTKFSVVQVAIRPPFFSDGFITNLIGMLLFPPVNCILDAYDASLVQQERCRHLRQVFLWQFAYWQLTSLYPFYTQTRNSVSVGLNYLP